jgi:hypothetical protein
MEGDNQTDFELSESNNYEDNHSECDNFEYERSDNTNWLDRDDGEIPYDPFIYGDNETPEEIREIRREDAR